MLFATVVQKTRQRDLAFSVDAAAFSGDFPRQTAPARTMPWMPPVVSVRRTRLPTYLPVCWRCLPGAQLLPASPVYLAGCSRLQLCQPSCPYNNDFSPSLTPNDRPTSSCTPTSTRGRESSATPRLCHGRARRTCGYVPCNAEVPCCLENSKSPDCSLAVRVRFMHQPNSVYPTSSLPTFRVDIERGHAARCQVSRLMLCLGPIRCTASTLCLQHRESGFCTTIPSPRGFQS